MQKMIPVETTPGIVGLKESNRGGKFKYYIL
jgi:hypothetical protein